MTDRLRFMARLPGTPAVALLPSKVEGSSATMRLYDAIDSWGGDWGVSAEEFATALDELPASVSVIELHINSPGGMVHQGIAIRNLLVAHAATVNVTVDGWACSAASFVAMAGDTITMAPNSEMMIHDAMNIMVGNAEDMRALAVELDRCSDNVASIYASRAGGTVESWREAMRAETWFSAEEAVTAGLADRVGNDVPDATNRFTTAAFAYAGRAAAPSPPLSRLMNSPAIRAGDPAAAGSTTRKESTVVDIPTTGLRERLGITDENADVATIMAALDEALLERSAPAAALPEGAVAIDSAVLADLQASARDGAEARAHQRAESYASAVEQAVKDGRITPAQRGTAPTAEAKGTGWLGKLHTEGADGVAALGTLAAGLVPVAEIGYGHDESKPDSAATIRETPLYKNWS